ncbi:MAG: carboxypeptidase-like regulatory domain-containing protein, partial [Fimbriimonadales bacterium]|nr:carboxypeptidase-like regulatory domain-containing protein [Fimbriimonadales bacterium]
MGYNEGMWQLVKGWVWFGLLLGALPSAGAQQWLEMRFHDSVSGRALSVEVSLTEQATQQVYSFRSQVDGRLTVWLPHGEYTLYARCEGYQPV